MVLLVLGCVAGCTDGVPPEMCRSWCGRDCAAMLAEMRPEDRTQLLVDPTSSTVTAALTDGLLARDPEAQVSELCPQRALCVWTNRAGVEYLCAAEEAAEVVEDAVYVAYEDES